jgi:DNA-directed RNA polymerase specialized sigma24 family protein
MKKKKRTIKKKKKIEDEDLIQVIDNISKKLAYKFKFGYHSVEDMKQQITIFALEGLENYDHKRPLENFLWTHVRNRLFNYKRDNYQRPNKPCLTCPLYDPHKIESNSECLKYNNKEDCDLYLKWTKRNFTKKNLMHFVDINNKDNNEISNNNILEFDNNSDTLTRYCDQEIIKTIEENLSNEYREIYLKLKNGIKISKKDMKKLIEHIKIFIKTTNE